MAYSNWDFGFGIFPLGMDRWGVFMGCRAGGWVSIMPWDLDALILMVGVGTHGGVKVKVGVRLREAFGSRFRVYRPKTRVQGVVVLCSMWGCGSSSFFRFGSAGVVVCVE